MFDQLQHDFFSLTVFVKDKTVEQWNFNGKFMRTLTPVVCRIGNDSLKSIYFFYYNKNKIYLNCLNPLKNKFIARDKYIIDYAPKNKQTDCTIYPVIFYDSNNDGTKEFYFFTNTGYSIQPRRVFEYDPAKDTIYISPKSYACLTNSMLDDYSRYNLNLVFATMAVGNGNIKDPYSDFYAWLMDFNKNLSFKFVPTKIGYYPSNSAICYLNAGNKKFYVVLNIYNGTKKHLCTLGLYNRELKLIKESKFEFTPEWLGASLYVSRHEPNCFYIIKHTGQILKLDYKFKIIKTIYIPPVFGGILYTADIDGNNNNEHLFMSKDEDKIIITRNDFSNYVTLNCQGLGNIETCSLLMDNKNQPMLSISSKTEQLILSYQFNYLYYLYYPAYALVYLLTALLILLIERIQRHRAELKYESEKKIAELQMKSIKNQLDPHFTLNILNSIGSLFYKQDRDKADYIFGKYARFLRLMVLNSDKFETTLHEELEYVEHYLELERFRSYDKFIWNADVEAGLDMKIKIPKMIIYTFVENAIKHGIRHLEKDGKIFISVRNNFGEYKIVISDNGVGRQRAGEIEYGNTGKGLFILDQILDQYFNLMKVKITYEIKDVFNNSRNETGTEVKINIPVSKNDDK
ncbi:MAG: histidine kinase [Actinobacteria bacterium]|nr:histidine kinase [Actinomycetota bacterium]